MSDSRLQRRFFEAAVERVRAHGCQVIVENNKHFKAIISLNDKKKLWSVSTTPKNRFSAQRDAIADLKRSLRELGVSVDHQHLSEGLLHMVVSNSRKSLGQELDQLIEVMPMIDADLFRKVLEKSYPELSSEELLAISGILDCFADIIDDRGDFDDLSGMWAVVRPADRNQGSKSLVCPQRLVIPASDKNKFFPYRWKNAFDFESAIETLLDIYERCYAITTLGIIVTNVWRPSVICKYRVALESFLQKNQKSVVLLSSGSSLLPVSLPWR